MTVKYYLFVAVHKVKTGPFDWRFRKANLKSWIMGLLLAFLVLVFFFFFFPQVFLVIDFWSVFQK